MAQTAKALFATADLSKHLEADRILTAPPQRHWVWPWKSLIPAYQVHKGRSYQKQGHDILQKAEANELFREGPGMALREDLSYVVQDLQDLHQTPGAMTAKASRRYKQRARNNFNKIRISSEAFEIRGTHHVSVGARDDTGMPATITTVTTTRSSQEPPPKLTMIEPVVPAQRPLLRPRIEPKEADPSTAVNNVIKWQLEQLSIVPEAPEESSAVLTEGYEGEPLCAGPSTAIPVAA